MLLGQSLKVLMHASQIRPILIGLPVFFSRKPLHPAGTLGLMLEMQIQHRGSIMPTGLRQLLNQLQTTYTGPKGKDIVLSEFRFAEPFEDNFTALADRRFGQLRIDYLTDYLDNLLA